MLAVNLKLETRKVADNKFGCCVKSRAVNLNGVSHSV